MSTRHGRQAKRMSGAAGTSNQHARDPDASRVWLPEIVHCIAGFLPENEVPCTLRLVCRATAQQFADRAIVRPAQPVPRWCFASECRRVCRGLTVWKRRELLCQTAASGDVANLEAALAETGCPFGAAVEMPFAVTLGQLLLGAAASAGKLGMCQWLVGPGRASWDEETATRTGAAAARGGHGEVVDWCLEPRQGVEPAEFHPESFLGIVSAALRKGHEGLTRRLLEAHPPGQGCLHWAFEAVAEGCGLACLQQAWESWRAAEGQADQLLANEALGRAVSSPTADWRQKCEFLLEKGCTLPAGAAEGVTESESLSGSAAVERLAWLQARGVGTDGSVIALSAAAERGDAVLVSYLLERGLKPDVHDKLAALEAGHMDVLQMLEAAEVADDEDEDEDLDLCAYDVAEAGSLAGLTWLVETYGAEAFGGLSSELFRRGSLSGNVDLLAWMRLHGCSWERGAWEAAAKSGCEAALELLAERGCPKPAAGQPYLEAASNYDVRTMAVLRRLGVSYGRDDGRALFHHVVGEGRDASATISLLAWLLANGCGVNWARVQRRSVAEGRPEVTAWLKAQQAPAPRAGGAQGGKRRRGKK